MVIKNDTLHTVWGSTRDGSLGIWYSRTKASIGGTTDIKLLNSESLIINTIPNPTTDHIMVSVNNKTKIDLLEIYSVSGKLIHSQKNNDFEIKLDLKHFADGIYQLKIQQGNLVSYKKIIKQ
ncbi:MAG: T9SS type A sorting domain-containing protein [Bacteroidetes bacterium]|nr:T9SS type A sorting domain-containing protein [Bacteroidota bacterium]